MAGLRHKDSVGYIIEHRGIPAGVMVYQLRSDYIQIQYLAVKPEYKRKGFARQLITHLVHKLPAIKRKYLCIHVREDILDLLLLLKSCKFEAINQFKKHNDYDLIRLIRWLTPEDNSATEAIQIEEEKELAKVE